MLEKNNNPNKKYQDLPEWEKEAIMRGMGIRPDSKGISKDEWMNSKY